MTPEWVNLYFSGYVLTKSIVNNSQVIFSFITLSKIHLAFDRTLTILYYYIELIFQHETYSFQSLHFGSAALVFLVVVPSGIFISEHTRATVYLHLTLPHLSIRLRWYCLLPNSLRKLPRQMIGRRVFVEGRNKEDKEALGVEIYIWEEGDG